MHTNYRVTQFYYMHIERNRQQATDRQAVGHFDNQHVSLINLQRLLLLRYDRFAKRRSDLSVISILRHSYLLHVIKLKDLSNFREITVNC